MIKHLLPTPEMRRCLQATEHLPSQMEEQNNPQDLSWFRIGFELAALALAPRPQHQEIKFGFWGFRQHDPSVSKPRDSVEQRGIAQ